MSRTDNHAKAGEYRRRAERLINRARDASNTEIQDSYRKLAKQYLFLAKNLDGETGHAPSGE